MSRAKRQARRSARQERRSDRRERRQGKRESRRTRRKERKQTRIDNRQRVRRERIANRTERRRVKAESKAERARYKAEGRANGGDFMSQLGGVVQGAFGGGASSAIESMPGTGESLGGIIPVPFGSDYSPDDSYGYDDSMAKSAPIVTVSDPGEEDGKDDKNIIEQILDFVTDLFKF